MELLLALVVVIFHCFLCVEIEASILRTRARADARIKTKKLINGVPRQISEANSLALRQLPQMFNNYRDRHLRMHYGPICKLGMQNNLSEIFGFTLNKGDPNCTHKYLTEREKRAEFLLSITPSQYIQKDRAGKNLKELRSCVESLASNLQKALKDDPIEIQTVVKDAVKHSLNTLKNNIESEKNSTFQLPHFPSPSFQLLMDQIEDKRALQNSLSPDLISSIYVAPNVKPSINSNIDSGSRHKSEINIRKTNSCNLSVKSSKSLNEILDMQDALFEKNKELMVN